MKIVGSTKGMIIIDLETEQLGKFDDMIISQKCSNNLRKEINIMFTENNNQIFLFFTDQGLRITKVRNGIIKEITSISSADLY